ncbi:UNVERIFIED_CONTAM: M42 family metallopeptidase, partial [Bacillus subtilis]
MTTEVNETVQLIQKLVSIPSPSGNTEKVIG